MENEKEKEKQLLTKPKEKLQQGKQGILQVVFGRTGIIFLLALVQLGILLICFKLIRDYVFVTYWGMVFLGLWLVVAIIGKSGVSDCMAGADTDRAGVWLAVLSVCLYTARQQAA